MRRTNINRSFFHSSGSRSEREESTFTDGGIDKTGNKLVGSAATLLPVASEFDAFVLRGLHEATGESQGILKAFGERPHLVVDEATWSALGSASWSASSGIGTNIATTVSTCQDVSAALVGHPARAGGGDDLTIVTVDVVAGVKETRVSVDHCN